MDQLLSSPFVQQYGALGVAFLLVCGLLWLIVRRVLPGMNETWSTQIAAERAARARESADDRQLFRDALGAQQQMFRDVLAEHKDTATVRHAEVIDKLDTIDGKVDRLLN